MRRQPIFLDRDGVVNHDAKPYITRADDLVLLPRSGEALGNLCRAGFDLYVVSNQQGVAKGFIPPEELTHMSARLQDLLLPFGATIKDFRYCTALESDGDPCRKPSPGMIVDLQQTHSLDLTGAYMIGDRWSDIEAGARAGLTPLLVMTGETKPHEDRSSWTFSPAGVFDDLYEAVAHILRVSAPE